MFNVNNKDTRTTLVFRLLLAGKPYFQLGLLLEVLAIVNFVYAAS